MFNDKYVDPTNFWKIVIDNKLGTNEKDMRVKSKCQALIWWIDNEELVVDWFVDQDAVWVAIHNWSVSRVDIVTSLGVLACWGAGNWSSGLLQEEQICYRSGNAGTGLVLQELVLQICCQTSWLLLLHLVVSTKGIVEKSEFILARFS